jgi:hypothetical protein
VPERRRAKVNRIKREIEEGTYRVDPELVVEGMLAHADRIFAERLGKDQSTVAAERRQKVVALRQRKPRPSVRSLALDFGVSVGTISEDLKSLQEAA